LVELDKSSYQAAMLAKFNWLGEDAELSLHLDYILPGGSLVG
jgi:hypothetical protein